MLARQMRREPLRSSRCLHQPLLRDGGLQPVIEGEAEHVHPAGGADGGPVKHDGNLGGGGAEPKTLGLLLVQRVVHYLLRDYLQSLPDNLWVVTIPTDSGRATTANQRMHLPDVQRNPDLRNREKSKN